MRRITLVLALIGASVLFLGATPGTAGAANCNAYMDSTYWTGYLEFGGYLTGCSGVSQVEFNINPATYCYPDTVYGGCQTGFGDGSEHDGQGLPGNHPALAPYNLVDSVQNITSSSTLASVTYRVSSWCGGALHWVFTQFIYRIRPTGGIFGPWHSGRSVGYVIKC